MPSLARLVPALAGMCLIAGICVADDLFEGLQPGLVARYRQGEQEVARVEPDVSAVWQGGAPLEGLSTESFSARWAGVLFVRSETTYRFSAFVQGKVQVRVGEQTVLAGEASAPQWITGPATALEFGFLPFEVSFEKTSPEAALKLYWSSEQFPLEPVPHHLLMHADDAADVTQIERGRVLFDAHRCNRCHAHPEDPPSAEAPPFIALAADLNPQWLVAKLQHKHAEAPHSLMPSFGFSAEQAEAVGAWLWQINQPPRITPLRPAEVDKKNPPPDGLMLVRSLGCLACHKLDELGESGPYGGGDLSHIGAKRTADWLYTWLGQPDRINPERRMPIFKLSPTERAQIATALAQLGHKPDMSYERPRYEENTLLVQRGRELVRQARCFNCHKTPAVETDTRGLPQLDRPVEDWSRSCLADQPDVARGRPVYPQADRQALRAYVETLTQRRAAGSGGKDAAPKVEEGPNGTATLAAFERGRLVLERRNCLGCHERDGARGIVATAGRAAEIDPRLRGLSEALIPPNLTAVGDKLRDAALLEAIGGDQKEPRLPWLRVRMPKFNHTDEERQALAAYLIAHDRIPPAESSPQTPIAGASSPPAAGSGAPADDTGWAAVDSETLLLGRQLVGAGGFSCIACHKVGDYEPRNTALGTRGSDLKGVGTRMREEFYIRWTRAPLRIVPGMEMPSYEERPVRGVLQEDVRAQLAVLWRAANDPRFEAPTNPSQVEQLLLVRPGESPQVLRDVFTASKENGGGYVPRAMALGFDNGHSLLFDLDRAAVRDWTFGDFARQRTEGKSWYWDLAGTPVVEGLGQRCEFVLKRGDAWTSLEGVAGPTTATLRSYGIVPGDPPAIEVRYALAVPGDTTPTLVEVTDVWSVAASDGGRSGVRRSLTCVGEGLDGELYCVPGVVQPRLLQAAIGLGAPAHECGEFGPGVRVPIASRTPGSPRSPSPPPAVIHYAAAEGSRSLDLPPRPDFPRNAAPVTTAPGFVGTRLELPPAMMPTALTFLSDGSLAVTSLKGDVLQLRDTNQDGLPESTSIMASGLAAPFGVLEGAHPAVTAEGKPAPAALELLVVHKPELLALIDQDRDGVAEHWQVRASGWGYTDNYHDWSAGPVRDAAGNLYVATSSDYAQPGRPEELCQWRGKVLRVAPDGAISPIAHELRYPMGIAFDSQGRLFVSDQQGVANTFNEIDHIVEGGRYGVKGLYDPADGPPERRAAIQIPHPWTRSVNGIFFIPPQQATSPLAPFAGHGIGCEYNGRFLIRFSLQDVGGELQGATYPFTRETWTNEAETFLGPICGTVAPNGDLYIGSIHDSGWLGGLNTGEIVRLQPTGPFPNGLREVRALPDGFELEFLHPIDPERARAAGHYALAGYTRVWKGSYATEDSGQYVPRIESIEVAPDGRTVRLHVDRLEPSYVYDVSVGPIARDGQELFPRIGYYTMNRVPGR